MRFPVFLAVWLVFCSCGPLMQRDLKQEYINLARENGMTPVYPPRGEVQVGDVYLVFTPADGGEDAALSFWVGRMLSVRNQALAYLASRDNVGGLMPDGTANVQPFGEMKELPGVNYPTITGSAASSASLGAIAPVFSGLFSVGSSDTVSMKFVNVRAFGVPFMTATLPQDDFLRTVCPVLPARIDAMFGSLGYDKNSADVLSPCAQIDATAQGQSCRVHVVTRTYLTRQIVFTYNQRRRVGISAATATPLPAAAPATPPPAVSVAIAADTAPDTATAVITALKAPASTNTGTAAATAVSETSQGLAFEQSFRDPLAIAYESISVPLGDAVLLCEGRM